MTTSRTAVRFSPVTFSIAFSVAYAVVFALNLPLFYYYPLHHDFSWGATALKGIGPPMAWYGLMASAAIIAVLCAVVIPERLLARPLRNFVWIFPCAAMLTCVYLLRHFFA
jgi:hypothetical protein